MLKKIFLAIIIFFNLYCVNASANELNLNVKHAVVIESSTGRILYEKDATTKTKIASTTKIMTAIIAVENCDMNETVVVSHNAATTSGSEVGIKENSKVTLKSLMYGMLLESGNDCATAIAEHVSGTVENFAVLMNQKAKEIGAYSTNFTNAHGLDTENNYSTAFDLALITKYAISIDEIKEILSTKTIEIKFDNEVKFLSNTNRLLNSYVYCDGGKTGFTGGANRCLVATAIKDGMRIIAVVLGVPTTELRFSETKKLFEYSFEKYKMTDISEYMNWHVSIPIYKGLGGKYEEDLSGNMIIPLREGEIEKIYIRQTLLPIIKAPMHIGSCLGDISMYIGNERIYNTEIILDRDIYKKDILDYMKVAIKDMFKIKVE